MLQDGRDQSLPRNFSPRPSTPFLSQYFSAIGLRLYLAFDGRHHRFALHYRAPLLFTCELLSKDPIITESLPPPTHPAKLRDSTLSVRLA